MHITSLWSAFFRKRTARESSRTRLHSAHQPRVRIATPTENTPEASEIQCGRLITRTRSGGPQCGTHSNLPL